jgi:glycerol-3-phosphate acyltransferase PlsY
VGHIWPIYLKFAGGGGLATALGVLGILMARETTFGLTIGLVILVITRNSVLSLSLSLIAVPLLLWWWMYPWWIVVFPVILLAIMLVHWMPNIRADVAEAGGPRGYLASLNRRRPRG